MKTTKNLFGSPPIWLGLALIMGVNLYGQAPFTYQLYQNTIQIDYTGPLSSTDYLRWDMGDGAVIGPHPQSQLSPTQFAHTYPATKASYQIVLVAGSSSMGVDSDTVVVQVECPIPEADFRASCRCDTVSFLDFTQSVCDYSLVWDFGDGDTSHLKNPVHVYDPATPDTMTVSLLATLKDDPGVTHQIVFNINKGGAYTQRDWPKRANRAVPEKFTPHKWLGPPDYPGDVDGNGIEDVLELPGSSPQHVLVALDRWDRNSAALDTHFALYGTGTTYIGKYISVIGLADVPPSQLDSLAQDSLVWMVFSDAQQPVLCLDTATYIHGVNALPGYPQATLQSASFSHPVNGKRVIVGLLDTGIMDQQVPGWWPHKINADRSYNALTGMVGRPATTHPHGLQIAQLMVAGWNRSDLVKGMAPKSKIADIKVVSDSGTARMSDLLKGLEWLIEQGDIKIACLPLSYPTASSGHDPLSELVNVARNQDILCVVAGGNDPNRNIGAPGAAREALTVSNLEVFQGANQSFSLVANSNNSGALISGVDDPKPNLGAIGTSVNLYSTYKDLASPDLYSGSSISAAVMAGIAALVRSYRPSFSPDQIKQLFEMQAIDIGQNGWDAASGAGFVDAYQVMDLLENGPQFKIGFPTKAGDEEWHQQALEVEHIEQISANSPEQIVVEIINSTADSVPGAVIKLFGSRYGTYFEQWFLGAYSLGTLAPGSNFDTLDFSTPIDLPSLCFRAEIAHPLDTTTSNNSVRNNYSERTTSPGTEAEICFLVTSPNRAPNSVLLTLKGSIPECWEVKFSNGADSIWVHFGADAPPQEVCVRVKLDTTCCNNWTPLPPVISGEGSSSGCGGCDMDALPFSILAIGDTLTNLVQRTGVKVVVHLDPVSGCAVSVLPPASSLILYPNPTPNQVVLRSQDLPLGEFQVRLISALGVPVWQTLTESSVLNSEGMLVDLSPFPAGIYFLEISGPHWSQVKKLVKL